MDDYLAKPVKSKTLERMLVRWSLNKRTILTPQLTPSDASECSENSENCTNAGIPRVGVEEDIREPEILTTAEAEAAIEETRTNLRTPRPRLSPEPSFFPAPSTAEPATTELPSSNLVADEASSPSRPDLQIPRLEPDELAQQSRDDKLIDAAGGSSVSPLGHTPMIDKGNPLTEANVEKFQQEEELRRMS